MEKATRKTKTKLNDGEANKRGNMPGVSDAGEKDNEPRKDWWEDVPGKRSV